MYRTGGVDRITRASGHNPPGIFRNSSEGICSKKDQDEWVFYLLCVFHVQNPGRVWSGPEGIKKKKTFNKKLNLTYCIAYVTREAVKIAVY